jgi:hypothetical protein
MPLPRILLEPSQHNLTLGGPPISGLPPVPYIISQWPVWYLGIVAYVMLLGLFELRSLLAARAEYASLLAAAQTPRERGRIHGYRLGVIVRILQWLVGGGLLLIGWIWVQILVAGLLLWGAPRLARDFAQGVAEGRKSAELASAIEYVAGRVKPTAVDWSAGALVSGLLRVVPAVALLLAWTLHSA